MSGHELVIVGAGPAGLGAAEEAGRLGVSVLVLDEYDRPGGQYMRQPGATPTAAEAAALPPPTRRGALLADAAAAAGATFWHEAQVWGAFPGRRVCLVHAGRGRELSPERVIVASGAHERPLAFPGWTLPGVMTPGAAQSLIKGSGVRPGQRLVVAGSGPFLVAVAHDALKAGVEIAGYVELRSPRWPALARLAAFPGRWPELARYARALLGARIPIFTGHTVTAAKGNDYLEHVEIAPVDGSGHPLHDGRRRLDADALAIGYGFQPSIEITRFLGAEHRFDPCCGGHYCVIDPATGATTAEGVHAAGEVTGIGGAQIAECEGRIAGLSVAHSLGHWSRDARRRLPAMQRARARHQRFARLLSDLFPHSAGPAAAIKKDTLVCRCEEVTAGDIAQAVAEGATDTGAVKMWTRAGMGPCQGRMCGWTINCCVAALNGGDAETIGFNPARIPAKPVGLERVLEGAGEPIPQAHQET